MQRKTFLPFWVLMIALCLTLSACARPAEKVKVNMDTFLKGESPESLWLDGVEFDDAVTEDTGETLDIFEPGMENLSDVGQIVIDAILAGEL